MSTTFKLPIGDWSGDGHRQCEYYIVESNKPIDAVREAHFNIIEKTGIDINSICSCTEEDQIDEDLMEMLKSMGFTPSNRYGDETILCADDVAEIWILLLMKADPTLDLTIIVEDEIEMLPFYGNDAKGRHIGNIGYGVLR